MHESNCVTLWNKIVKIGNLIMGKVRLCFCGLTSLLENEGPSVGSGGEDKDY